MEAIPWIALQLCPGLPPILRRRLLQRYGGAQAIMLRTRAELRAAGVKAATLKWLRQPDARGNPALPWSGLQERARS